MALFNQSTKAVSAAVGEIADSVGASGDAEMQNRAGRSLFAALEHWNTRYNWDFLLTEADPISITGPFALNAVTASAGQSSAQVTAGHGILIDDLFSDSGNLSTVPGLRVQSTAATSFTFNGSFIGTAAGNQVVTGFFNRDFYNLPSDFRNPYSIRLYGSMVALRPIRRRQYDRSIVNEFTISSPIGYDIFSINAKGKIRLVPPPSSTDTMQIRYYRRITIPATTASVTALDILQDHEPYLIAWAKWHFLMDKGEGRGEQAATWFQFANEGIKTMQADQTRVPDEDLIMLPGAYSYNPAFGPNSVRGTLDNYSG